MITDDSTHISDKIASMVDKIKKQEIHPTPKWKIESIRLLRWLLVTLCILMGIVAFTLVWVDIVFDPTMVFSLGAGRFMRHFLVIVPQLWLAFLALSTAAGVYLLRKTVHGYRYKIWILLGTIAATVSTLGIISHQLRFDENLENFMNRHPDPDMRDRIFPPREQRWLQPDQGVLTGMIQNIESDSMRIKSPREELWMVSYDEKTKPFGASFNPGQLIMIVGEKTGDLRFHALLIRPLPTRQPMQSRSQKNGMQK